MEECINLHRSYTPPGRGSDYPAPLPAYPQRLVHGASRTFESPPVKSLLQHSILTAGCSRFGSWPEEQVRTPHRKPRSLCPPPSSELRESCSTSIFPITCAAAQGGGAAERSLAVSWP